MTRKVTQNPSNSQKSTSKTIVEVRQNPINSILIRTETESKRPQSHQSKISNSWTSNMKQKSKQNRIWTKKLMIQRRIVCLATLQEKDLSALFDDKRKKKLLRSKGRRSLSKKKPRQMQLKQHNRRKRSKFLRSGWSSQKTMRMKNRPWDYVNPKNYWDRRNNFPSINSRSNMTSKVSLVNLKRLRKTKKVNRVLNLWIVNRMKNGKSLSR